MKYLLSEGKQVGTLYHYTDFFTAISILKEGFLRSDAGGPGGTLKDPEYMISFTRDKNFAAVRRNLTYVGGNLQCRFVVDGDKISHKFPIEQFAARAFKKGTRSFEAEERIRMKYAFRIPLKDYLVSFDILTKIRKSGPFELGRDDYDYHAFNEDYLECIRLAKEKGHTINLVNKNFDPLPFKEENKIIQFFKTFFNMNEDAASLGGTPGMGNVSLPSSTSAGSGDRPTTSLPIATRKKPQSILSFADFLAKDKKEDEDEDE
jgi:hypothetical protein